MGLGRIDHTQYLAIALHCTNIELFLACVLLALYGEPTPVPIILRSMYEALVDLDNLLRDATYVDRIESANLTQMLKFEDTGAMSKNEADAFKARLGEFVAKKRGPMDLRARCEKVGRMTSTMVSMPNSWASRSRAPHNSQ